MGRTMNRRNPVTADFWWVLVIVLAIRLGCDMEAAKGQGPFRYLPIGGQTARGQDLFRGLDTGGWRRSSPRRSDPCAVCSKPLNTPGHSYSPQITTITGRSSPPQMSCPPSQCGPGGCGPQQQTFGNYVPPPPPQRITQPAPPMPPQQHAPLPTQSATLQPSTVRVSFEGPWINGKMEAPEGSGSFVAWDDSRTPPRWLVVTAGHVQEGGYTSYIIWRDQKLSATVLMPNSSHDLMALECAGPPSSQLVLPLATEYAKPGETVRFEGLVGQVNSKGLVTGYGGIVGSGNITGYRKTHMDVDGHVQGGMSGGPIYNRNGLQGVIAISAWEDGVRSFRGTATLRLRDLLSKAGIHVEGTRYRLNKAWGPQPNEPPEVVTIQPNERPAEIVIPVPTGPIEPNLEDYPLPVPDVDTTTPPAQPHTHAGIEALAAELAAIRKQLDGLKGEKGDKGDSGEPGPPGELSEEDVKIYAAGVAAGLLDNEKFIAAVAGLVEVEPYEPPKVPPGKSHLILVRDTSADYWPRMADELKTARGLFSGIREEDPPPFATVLPRLVGYQNGVAVLDIKGLRSVSDSLNAITRGEFQFPREGES